MKALQVSLCYGSLSKCTPAPWYTWSSRHFYPLWDGFRSHLVSDRPAFTLPGDESTLICFSSAITCCFYYYSGKCHFPSGYLRKERESRETLFFSSSGEFVDFYFFSLCISGTRKWKMTSKTELQRLPHNTVTERVVNQLQKGREYRILHGKCVCTVFTHELGRIRNRKVSVASEWDFWYKTTF